MPILADTHVHLYPAYDAGALFRTLSENLGRLAVSEGVSDAARVACLVERQGQQNWRALCAGAGGARPAAESGACEVPVAGATLYVIDGHQFVSAERIEILCLAVSLEMPDGQPSATYVEQILAVGGVPVLPWAPGKWWFARRRVVANLVARFGADLLLGDTTLRPLGWGTPLAMRAARRRGVRIVAGSDPLPFASDDRVAGTYATRFDAPFDPKRPVSSMRAALRQSAPPPQVVGDRGAPWTVASRLRRLKSARTA